MITRYLPFRSLICWLLLSGAALTAGEQNFTPPPGSPLAKREHPRLYFTRQSLLAVKEYIDRYEAANFQHYLTRVDSAFAESPATKSRNYLLLDAKNFAFLSYAASSGLFSNYQFRYSGKEYAEKAYAHAEEIARRMEKKFVEQSHAAIFNSSSQGGYVNLALGVVYDWCYDHLSLSQKRVIADALITNYRNREKDINPGGKVKLGLTISAKCHDVGVGGLALWGDVLGSEYAAVVQEMLNGVEWLWLNRVLRMGEHLFEGTAGWSEGANYFGGGAVNIIWFAAAMSSALGQNFFMEMNWLRDIPKYLYFYVYPMRIEGERGGFFEQRNDAVDLREWDSSGTLLRISAITGLIKSADPDHAGFYRWIMEDSEYKFIQQSLENYEPRLFWLFYKFLWGFKDIDKKTPEQVGLKTAYRFGLGDVILRSDLSTQNATKINFYTPKYHLARHYHKDNSSFVIFKYGLLALDAGVTKGSTDLPKSKRSNTPIYHNLLAMYPPNGSPFYEFNANTNDYADAYNDPDNQPGGRNHVGDVLALRFEPEKFDFVDYDYTRSYKQENYARRMRRKLLYLRDPHAPNYSNQEYLLIFDDVLLSDPAIKRRWLLHTSSRPEIVQGDWTREGPGFWTAPGRGILAVTNSYENAHGKLFLTFLAPGNYQLRLRGGSEGDAHYWFTDAEGNDLSERGPFTPRGGFWAGTHRLEVEDLSGDSASQYLAVMQIGDAHTLKTMATVEKLESGDFIGAFINGERVAFFNHTPGSTGGIHYRISTPKTVRHLITGLKPGEYTILQNQKRLSAATVEKDGSLFFESTGGGEFVVESR